MNKLKIIYNICCSCFSDDWTEKTRRKNVIFQRAIYYKIARDITRQSLQQIGAKVNKEHATVSHGLKVFKYDIQGVDKVSVRNDEMYELYQTVRNKCKKVIWFTNKRELTKKEMLLHQNINLREENKKLKQTIKNLIA